jgi:S-adenosylmethionine:tRNA ribosyltransferase-isomerase
MKLTQFDYSLPQELIAQEPAEPRDSARLFVYDRANDTVTHAHIADLPSLLPPSTVLVANNSKVRRSRLFGRVAASDKKHLRTIELLLLEPLEASSSAIFRCLVKGHRVPLHNPIELFGDVAMTTRLPFSGELLDGEENRAMNTFRIRLNDTLTAVEAALERFATMPLPPYIRRSTAPPERYQTVYANPIGSAAAPTAGLHFTPELITSLKESGHPWESVTLHVGLGTFLPLHHEDISENQLHFETTFIDENTANRLEQVRENHGRILAIGTTATRTLESHSHSHSILAGEQRTNLFIYPGYTFRTVNTLLTNFHLPKSSLLLLVSAFLGNLPDQGVVKSEEWMIHTLQELYKEAIYQKYRFYSFGDAMLIL